MGLGYITSECEEDNAETCTYIQKIIDINYDFKKLISLDFPCGHSHDSKIKINQLPIVKLNQWMFCFY